jgi:hypothetical protein
MWLIPGPQENLFWKKVSKLEERRKQDFNNSGV